MSPICSRGRGAGYVYVRYATRFSTNFCSICFIQVKSNPYVIMDDNVSQNFSLLPSRRLQQFHASGDRQDILAMDGNCTLHRRTCGVPCAEILESPHVNKLLMRGCSCKPSAKDTLCHRHMEDRDRPVPLMYAEIGRHRLKKALHSPGDVCFLEIEMSGYRGWIPANTVPEAALAKYFAEGASRNIEMRTVSSLIRCRCLLCSHFSNFPFKFFFCTAIGHACNMAIALALVSCRRQRSKESRQAKWGGMRPRGPKTFLASWSSAQPRASSSCQTHKESEQHVAAAARTAGYLLAVSESGLLSVYSPS